MRLDKGKIKREILEEVKRLQSVLCLNDWIIDVEFRVIDLGVFAEALSDPVNRHAILTFDLDKLSSEKSKGFNHKRIARHEMIHVLTARLKGLGDERFISEDQIQDEYEHLSRVLERFDFRLSK